MATKSSFFMRKINFRELERIITPSDSLKLSFDKRLQTVLYKNRLTSSLNVCPTWFFSGDKFDRKHVFAGRVSACSCSFAPSILSSEPCLNAGSTAAFGNQVSGLSQDSNNYDIIMN